MFATVVASVFAVLILVWAGLDLIVHPGAGGSWQELIGAVIGNFVFVWIVMMGFSLLIRFLKKD